MRSSARYGRDRFERRFNRGLDVRVEAYDNPWDKRPCSQCGCLHLALKSDPGPRCFDCTPNPYWEKNIRMTMDATGEDSTDPKRISDGTQAFNMGIQHPDVQYGSKNAYGQRTVLQARPYANNEITSGRKLREIAKRNGLTPLETQKRALPR